LDRLLIILTEEERLLNNKIFDDDRRLSRAKCLDGCSLDHFQKSRCRQRHDVVNTMIWQERERV
jgi:hypothetical protein